MSKGTPFFYFYFSFATSQRAQFCARLACKSFGLNPKGAGLALVGDATGGRSDYRTCSETPVPSEIDFNTGEEVPADSNQKQPGQSLFNRCTAKTLVKRLPLDLLIRLRHPPVLPKHLRREVAQTAWIRSILIDDMSFAEKLQPVLPDLHTPLWPALEP